MARKPLSARDWIGSDPFPWPSIHDVDVGATLVGCYCIASLQVGTTKNDKPYLTLTLSDRHGAVEAKVWDDAEAVRVRIESATFVGVRGRVETFRDARQLKVDAIEPVALEGDELELFMPRSKRDQATMEGELVGWIGSVADPGLRTLLGALLGPDTESGRAFRYAPAAKQNHHAYVGGLLEHTLSLAGICDGLARHYNAREHGPRIDRDLLLTGALLHDIGKIREISTEPGFRYTTEGKLLGHILIGLDLVRDAGRAVAALSPERLDLVLHLVASHQGRYEWQSPREPLLLEALLLHHADDMDAKLQQAMDFLDGVDEGTWSGYNRSFGRTFFKAGTATAGEDTAGEGTAGGGTAGGGTAGEGTAGGGTAGGGTAGRDPFTLDMFEG